MNLRDAQPAGWRARLELGYVATEGRTVLARRRHVGPLLVQKPFYPEGARVCHSTLVHPPGGIAGGDRLELHVTADAGAHATITTPGAAKWYRSNGLVAEQRCELNLAADAMLEWLPQPGIVFNGARANLAHRVVLQPGARYIGWDVICLGRIAHGERFDEGEFHASTQIVCEHKMLWSDYARICGGSSLLSSPAGLAGFPVSGLFLAAGVQVDANLLGTCRQVAATAESRCGITSLPQVFAARFLGRSTEDAWNYFTALWEILRPVWMGRPACRPRIWNT